MWWGEAQNAVNPVGLTSILTMPQRKILILKSDSGLNALAKEKTMPFLPITKEEMTERGWFYPDFIIVTGDSYVDHPSFGTAIISRVLENEGFNVCILPQPKTDEDYLRFGKPRYAFLVNGGNIDSMVAHYTAAKKKRTDDAYTAGGRSGGRPDRAVIVYCQNIRRLFSKVPIAIGGLEASLRRFAHYD